MVVSRSWSRAARHASGGVFLNKLDGGSPELVTQMSIRPKCVSTAATKSVTALESVTSSARRNTSGPVDFSVRAAVSSSVRAVRADGDMGAFAAEFPRDSTSQPFAARHHNAYAASEPYVHCTSL